MIENEENLKRQCATPQYLKCFDTDFRNYYRKQTADIKDKRLHHYDNDRIIRLFLKKVNENLTENRAGVHINKIGYFFAYKHPFNFHKSVYFNHLKKYMFTFIPTENSIFKFWSMDFKFNRALTKRLSEKVKKGYRYLNMINGVSKKEYMYLGAAYNAILNKKKKDEFR